MRYQHHQQQTVLSAGRPLVDLHPLHPSPLFFSASHLFAFSSWLFGTKDPISCLLPVSAPIWIRAFAPTLPEIRELVPPAKADFVTASHLSSL